MRPASELFVVGEAPAVWLPPLVAEAIVPISVVVMEGYEEPNGFISNGSEIA